MKLNAALRLIAGIMILLSLALATTVHMNWLYFTGFIALNLMQSSLTGWCPMMAVLRKAGLEE